MFNLTPRPSPASDAPTLPQRVPVTVLTGFLGSGKTTLLNRLLREPDLRGTAVIINEFGAVGLDHDLVAHTDEQMVLLSNGCICCTIRGDLVGALERLAADPSAQAGTLRHVVLETTGLADPAPILHTLMGDPRVVRNWRLAGVATTVDAVNGNATLDRQPEAVKQVAVADRLFLTKTDLATPEARELASLGADACQRLNRAVIALSDKDRKKDALVYCQEVDSIETQADKVFKKAITRLFANESDIWAAMKLKEFYFLLENVLDYCEDAAKTIEGILIENA